MRVRTKARGVPIVAPHTPRRQLQDQRLARGRHDAFRRAAALFLQRYQELDVLGALHRGEETLAQAPKLQPQAILIDPGLSRPGGLETIPRLRSMLPETSIIVLSLDDSTAYCQAMLSVGADDCVCKSKLVTDLLPAIRRAALNSRSRQRR